jgi:hypothetical protein
MFGIRMADRQLYVAQEQIREVREDLPRGFYRALPKLAEGPLQGYPRVFGVAWAFVAHTDSHFEPEMLCRFVRACQRVQPLTIGELWAVAITLRIVLVENLRRAAERIVNQRAVLVRISDLEGLDGVRQLLRAHECWRMKQLAADLVIPKENPASYAQDLHSSLEAMVRASQSRRPSGKEGGRAAVFILRDEQVSPQTRTVLQSAARAVIWNHRRGLKEFQPDRQSALN